jgi:hypothetical protein
MKINTLPQTFSDSAEKTLDYFNNYNSKPLEFTSNEIDQIIAFFTSNGFSKESADLISSIFLEESKKTNLSILSLLNSLKTQEGLDINQSVALILNKYRSPTSKLGFKSDIDLPTSIKRNLIP